MKEQKNNRSQWLHIRLSADEKQQLEKAVQQTTCRNISDYARKVLQKKPVVVRVRDESKEELLNELTALRKELNAIGNNFNQLIRKMQLLGRKDQLEAWFRAYQAERDNFPDRMRNIEFELKKLVLKWWP
ncbi:hypothetical protein GCM10023091_00230 [Ravibacter arvi]|uniref:Plasmid mobilization relaxosome protein MobC n=1 Tax=Ravibacter arvi TaxID=2051041 RepID=A0ABP8LKJ5_9BACT